MLHITVFTPGGIILWQGDGGNEPSRQSSNVPESVLDSFVSDVYLNGKNTEETHPWRKNGYTIRHGTINELKQLRVAVVHESIVLVDYAEALVGDCRRILKSLAGPDADVAAIDFDKFGRLVNARVSELQAEQKHRKGASAKEQEEDVDTDPNAEEVEETGDTPEISDPETGKKPKPRRRKKKETTKGSESKSKKKMRRWDDNGAADYDDTPLDFSSETNKSGAVSNDAELVTDADSQTWTHTNSGDVVPGYLEDELHDILNEDDNTNTQGKPSSGFLSQWLGGKKGTLTADDLAKAHEKMVSHLMKKNVAREAAEHLWTGVEKSLVGTKSGAAGGGGLRSLWSSGVDDNVRGTMKEALRRILTPSTSVDLLHEIKRKRDKPYVISVVGVNGVGKSTNLAKIAFWLIQNNYKVLIAACDTFRSGAVEQLRVHVTRLKSLSERLGRSSDDVDIFDQGYGKDAAVIAQKAVDYGRRNNFDIVLIDTAGRRHNDDRLMSSLEKFGNLANPDKIIMVAEALVGTDSVQQARHFNSAFGPNRHLDFFLVSKCDTVGDMVGTLVNMTYSTGVPVLFVGVGQNFTDLRALSVDWAVDLLLK